MPKRIRPTHLYELAKRGAEVQFRELIHEAKLLVELFPHLRDSFDKDELPLNFIMARGSGAARRKAGARPGPVAAAARGASRARTRK